MRDLAESGTLLLPLNESSGNFSAYCTPRTRKRTYSHWSPSEEGITLAWRDLSVYSKSQHNRRFICKKIINAVSGAVKAGSLVAIMGASGSGKTTLMSALAYRNALNTHTEGDVLINGRQIGDYMKYLSGFMHQDDIFVGSLTVYEHMNVMARLKLDRRTTHEERACKIFELLRQLGLMKCLNTKIGGFGNGKDALSGGEKKRLAFATELLTDPPILFCDEPTTGLDSYSAQKLVTMMNTMASTGKTILCTIHQPSSDIFAMFSQLILVAEGRIAFMGSASNAVEFLEKEGYVCPLNYNLADFFIKTLATTPGSEESSRLAIKRICDLFAVSDYCKEVDVVLLYEFHMGRAVEGKTYKLRGNFRETFFWVKFYWLTYRWFVDILRNPLIQGAKILQKIGVAIIIGLCYLGTDYMTQNGVQSVQGALFIVIAENTFGPMYAVLDDFPQNYPLFLREYKSGLYSCANYYLSRIVSMLPGLIIDPFLFTVIVYWLVGLRATTYAFFVTLLSIIMTLNVATACGIFFSNAFDSAPTALAYLVPFDYVLMATSGLFIKLTTLPQFIHWTKYLSWIMYSAETMSIVQWQGVMNISCNVPDLAIPCVRNGTQVLEKFSFSENNIYRDLWCMGILYVTFYSLGFLCLWWKTKNK